MFTIRLLLALSLLLLGAFIPSSWPSPVSKRYISINPPGRSHTNNTLVQRVVAANTCSASWIQAAETRANKGPHQTISTLCSSVLSKYKTVTHSVYTKTVTPRTTIDTATTAPRQVVTATRTAEVTRKSTNTEESTSVTDVTTVVTDTSIVETDYTTITAVVLPRVRPRREYPCQEIESILTLLAGSATPFCSCYIPSSTSTTTVTCDGATTATPVRVTDDTKTVTPTPSTAYTTVYQTTTVITTVESETLVTSIVTSDTTISVTETVTSTVPPLSTNTGYIQVQNPLSSYNGYYAFLDLSETEFAGRPIQLSSSISDAQVFSIDSSSHLNTGEYTGEQNSYADSNDPSSNAFYMAPANIVAENTAILAQPTCSVSATLRLSCTEAPADARNVISICPSTAAEYGGLYGDTPYLVLDTQVVTNCELAELTVIPQP